MNFPSWMDPEKLAIVIGLTLMLTQYLKEFLPEGVIKLAAIAIAILVSWLTLMASMNPYAKIVLYALFAVAGADTGYQFLSSKKSAAFTLPSRSSNTKS